MLLLNMIFSVSDGFIDQNLITGDATYNENQSVDYFYARQPKQYSNWPSIPDAG